MHSTVIKETYWTHWQPYWDSTGPTSPSIDLPSSFLNLMMVLCQSQPSCQVRPTLPFPAFDSLAQRAYQSDQLTHQRDCSMWQSCSVITSQITQSMSVSMDARSYTFSVCTHLDSHQICRCADSIFCYRASCCHWSDCYPERSPKTFDYL